MLEVTSDYIKTIENHLRVFEANFDLNGKRYTKTKIASATYDSSIGNSNDFTIGGGYINSLEIEIKEIIEGLQEMMPATMSVAIAGKTVPLGKFFVTEVKLDRNDKKTKIKLQDEFVRLSGAYDSQLTYPAYTRDILSEIVRLTGITTDTNIQLVNDQVAKKLEKTSYREALVYLAQLSGSFVRFNRNGKLDFIKLKTTSRHITKDMYKPGGLERDEIPYRLKGIECKSADKVVYKSGLSTGNIMKLKNPWVTQEILDRVFNEYRDFNFYPYTLSWRGDMAMESGDWVTVHWDENIYFDIPMLSYKLSFDGGLSAHSSGNAAGVAQGTYKYKGSMQRQIEYLDELITKQGSMYLDTASPTKPKNGDIWFKPNGGYVEMWEHVEGSWVKKADSANVGEIVNTITTDELLTKKVSAAIGNYITLNAKNITAGDLDLARLRIMNGLQEIVSVRDGKVVMNIDKLTINAQDVATKEDLKKIELTPGPQGERGQQGVPGIQGLQGPKGDQGIPGTKGADGRTPYLHRAWANSSDGRDGFSTSDSTNKRYLGTLTDFTEADSQDPARYKWTALFDNVQVGGKNYIRNASFLSGENKWGKMSVNGLAYNFTHSAANKGKSGLHMYSENDTVIPRWKGIYQKFLLPQPAYTPITVSALFAKDGAPQEAHIGIHFIKDGVIARQSWLDIPVSQISDKYQRFSLSAKHDIPFDEIRVMLYVGYDKIVNLYVTDVQLEIGNVMTDFRLSDEDAQDSINSKADQGLTQEQLNALAEKAQLHDVELKAKATMDQFSDLEKAYNALVKSNAES
ncbi:TPA: collagen-like protein, partial [Streptococcus pneumoniae]